MEGPTRRGASPAAEGGQPSSSSPPNKTVPQALSEALENLQRELVKVVRCNRALTESLSEARRQLQASEEKRQQLASDLAALCSRMHLALAGFEEKHKALGAAACSATTPVDQLLLLADFLRLKLHINLQQHLAQDEPSLAAGGLATKPEEGAPGGPPRAALKEGTDQLLSHTLDQQQQQQRYEEVVRENKQLQQQNECLEKQLEMLHQQQQQQATGSFTGEPQAARLPSPTAATAAAAAAKGASATRALPAAWGPLDALTTPHCLAQQQQQRQCVLLGNTSGSAHWLPGGGDSSSSGTTLATTEAAGEAAPAAAAAATPHTWQQQQQQQQQQPYPQEHEPTTCGSGGRVGVPTPPTQKPAAAAEAAEADSSLEELDTSRSCSSMSSNEYSHRSFGAVAAVPPRRPSFVPYLSTAKAGPGSWMGGLKDPGEYPVGN
ncbi:hypothetical protein Esti_006817 [Eimeria stiedai]